MRLITQYKFLMYLYTHTYCNGVGTPISFDFARPSACRTVRSMPRIGKGEGVKLRHLVLLLTAVSFIWCQYVQVVRLWSVDAVDTRYLMVGAVLV